MLEFDSDRKMMSVIVKDETGKIELLTKGADTSVEGRLRKDERGEDLKKCKKHIKRFA